MHVLRNFRVFKALHHSGMVRFVVGLRILASRSLLRNLPTLLCRNCFIGALNGGAENTGPENARPENEGPSVKGSPYLITGRRDPELIPVLGSQPAGDVSHKPDGRLPLLSHWACSYPRNP